LKIQDGGGRHLENHKIAICLQWLTDLYEIWYGDAKWVLTTLTIKNLNSNNPKWRTAAILKTVKSPYLCNRATDFDEISTILCGGHPQS